MPNKALQQNRGDVLRYGESIGCDLLKAAVLPDDDIDGGRGGPPLPGTVAKAPKNRPAGAESGSANRIPPDDVEGGQSPSGHAAGRRANRITIV
jgi:hypothetical protein